MKKITSVILSFAVLFLGLGANIISPMKASATANINIGDYVVMGKYYDEPILWRCVDIDENGPLMLSDKIISIKSYDAGGDNTANGSSHGRAYDNGQYRKYNGSHYWADSNMRSWLNSTASAGNIAWLCGNPPTNDKVWNGYNDYATEKGFLADGNFTANERYAIKTVTQKSLLNGYEYSSTPNSNVHRRDDNISSVVQNYDTAYSEQVTDKMFLLDVKQVNRLYENSATLGTSYYIGQPTQKAVDNSEYKSTNIATGKNWYYWLRSPHAEGGDGVSVRFVLSGGSVSDCYGCDNILGVRPAFYINLSSAIFTSGNGSETEPYVIAVEGVFIDCSEAKIIGKANETITANIPVYIDNYSKQNLSGKLVVSIFSSNKLIKISQRDLTVNKDNQTIIEENFEIDKTNGSDYKVKVFWWGGFNSLKPLCKTSEANISVNDNTSLSSIKLNEMDLQ